MTTSVGALPVNREGADWPLYLDGDWVGSGQWQDVCSPYDRRLVARFAAADAALARRAVDAAAVAMRAPFPAHARAAVLERAAECLRGETETAANLLCREAGKPIRAARAEAERAASTIAFSAVEARKLVGDMVAMDAAPSGEHKLAFTLRVPIGVVGAISPFNFPLNLVAHKVAPAIAAGCAVVLKPASQTPMSALYLAEMFQRAGLPAGWLNVVPGPAAEIGDVLVADERVRLITFTGSGPVGWELAARAARKRVSLELGNAAPVIVAADANARQAARAVAANAFMFAGQSCISIQRVYVDASIHNVFVAELVEAVRQLRTGDPAEEATDVGPVIDVGSRERILEWIGESGGEILIGGGLTRDGLIEPTVIADPRRDAKVCTDEVFGPVCSVTATHSLPEAIALSNGTRLGLQASIYTESHRTALHAARELEFGGVLVNEVPSWRTDQMPYGGVKDSGNTKEGPAYAVREMTEERLVVLPF